MLEGVHQEWKVGLDFSITYKFILFYLPREHSNQLINIKSHKNNINLDIPPKTNETLKYLIKSQEFMTLSQEFMTIYDMYRGIACNIYNTRDDIHF